MNTNVLGNCGIKQLLEQQAGKMLFQPPPLSHFFEYQAAVRTEYAMIARWWASEKGGGGGGRGGGGCYVALGSKTSR